MSTEVWDHLPDGRAVHRVELGEAPGVVVRLLTLGAAFHEVEVTGGDGVRRSVVLTHPDAASYLAGADFRGVTVGRYANRIAGGRFELDGRTVQVGTNDRGHALHGGPDGFGRRLWRLVEEDGARAVLALTSPDGDQGFPGRLEVEATVEVSADGFRVGYAATTDAPTVVNLAHHAYVNLGGVSVGVGAGSAPGAVDDHELVVEADSFTPIDGLGIPLGDHAPVAATAVDLRHPRRVGDVLAEADAQLEAVGGLDHNYVLRGRSRREGRPAAVVTSPRTGTRLELDTDQPGVQVYTGGSLEPARTGLALEAQLAPDTPNRSERPGGPGWPSARLDPGQVYRSWTTWRFTTT